MRTQIADLQVELLCHAETLATAAPYAVPPQGDADMVISSVDYHTLPI